MADHDDWYDDYYLSMPNCKFKERINHKNGTKKINDKIYKINRS